MMVPAFTVLMAIGWLGEVLQQFHITGVALIGVGIYFSTLSRGKGKSGKPGGH